MARIAVIHKEKCNPEGCGGYLCIRVCPINRTGAECITKGEDQKPFIDESLCTGCGICPNRCPFDAISIINLPEELKQEPIHRYGPNAFALYSLPTPVFGKVTGIIGKNAIGKSTAIKILAGALKPNFGKAGYEAGYDDLVEFFKGSETQNFFEKLRDGKIKIAYKPQNIELLAKQAKGKVVDLLSKVDEKGILPDVARLLSIHAILDRDIANVSGGELQRIAIAATVLKKANLYIFDEPTSFLDIKQRLKVAQFIRSLADDETSILVIEHDLIALDYMADVVNIMYGKPDAYGVVSHLKNAKAGINAFLEGFLKEENVRFRDYRITFKMKSPVEKQPEKLLASWSEIKKSYDGFSLATDEGTVFREEVVGILGENGIGKTTLIRMIAGETLPDSGMISEKVKVSYKPQYLEQTDEFVGDVLHIALQKHYNDIVAPLGLKDLLTRRLNELSGGQLQRVAIAKTLSEDASLVLLDEPSAYLDIEQRLLIAKIISNIAVTTQSAIMVVDHDLVFIDNISGRLLVFSGTPAETGQAKGPFGMEDGMNRLLSEMKITLRRDEHSGRPRINKLDSQKDREQKQSGKYYYT